MPIYTLVGEPAGPYLTSVLRAGLDHCDEAGFVVRDGLDPAAQTLDLLRRLEAFGLCTSRRGEWPGTVLAAPALATVYTFDYRTETAEILGAETHSLYDWLEPDLPEDLCLYRPGHVPWLVSITHEADAFLAITEQERQSMAQADPLVEALLGPPDPSS